jgi:outer membrane lipoprotein SlyB
MRRVSLLSRFTAIALIIAPLLGGCGTLAGAGAGGYVGNQFGKGEGKAAATAAGVIGGGLLGHAITGY